MKDILVETVGDEIRFCRRVRDGEKMPTQIKNVVATTGYEFCVPKSYFLAAESW
jgi:hypothetical protein